MELSVQREHLMQQLSDARPLFTDYLSTIVSNEHFRFWNEDTWSAVRGIHISYDTDDFTIYCSGWDQDMDECPEEAGTSFFTALYNKARGREDADRFLPAAMDGVAPDYELYEDMNNWITGCWQDAVKGRTVPPGFVNEYDGRFYRDMETGEMGDHIFVMKRLAPEVIEEETTDDEGYIHMENRAGKVALKAPDGKMVCGFIYDYIGDVKDGMAMVSVNDLFGFIDTAGHVIISPQYDYSMRYYIDQGHFFDGVTAVQKGDKWGFIDRHNNVIIPFMYDNAGRFNDGIVNVALGAKWGYINLNNETVLPFIYQDHTYPFYGAYAQVNLDGNKGFIDREGHFYTEKPGDIDAETSRQKA